MKKKRLAFVQSMISLLLCFSMLVGTTFAWFTDSVTTGINTIAAGVLDVELYHSNAAVTDEKVDAATKLFMDLQGNPILWEPGVVSYENLRVANAGDLALVYQLAINTANENYVVEESGAQYGLSQILKVGVVEGGITATDRASVVASVEDANWMTLENFVRNGSLLPEGEGESEKTWGVVIYWEPGEFDNYWNLNNGKKLNEGEVLSIDLGIKLIATQEQYESDAFGTDYDNTAKTDVFPVFVPSGSASTTVIPNDQNQTAADILMTAGQVTASIPAGVQLAAGTTELTMSVTEMDGTGSNITLGENEAMRSLDVHIEGVDGTNQVPMIIDLGEVMPTGLNEGNAKVFHVENGNTNAMTRVATVAEVDAHNEFYYDPATGRVVVAMATFSELTCVVDSVNPWNGTVATAFAGGTGTKDDPYIIANADQLAYFGKVVGGMDGHDRKDFADEYVKLISDINLGDKDNTNGDLIFHPIGYYYNENYTFDDGTTGKYSTVYSFEGTFDGAGHTIANFYQNTWEIKGDYDGNYYKDAMGLFGYVVGGAVKNLTVDHFSSDGEFTPTGVIAAYAVNSTFENIAITNCNPRVYNTGNGGIIGIAGRENDAVESLTLKNITVDNSNKISALWGSWDVACGGLVGMYRGNADANGNATGDTISFTNCHVAAQIDVYNDVCANYQYYAYRYAGMIIGSIRHNKDEGGKTIPNMTGITASGCTVNYGNWNDYYYCELEHNSPASYSEDFQFSRLEKVETLPDSAEGTKHYYVKNSDGTITCRHFIDGKLHKHTDAEDKTCVYLPFDQMFTGYGWGVNSQSIDELPGVINITKGDQDESVVKFASDVTELANNTAIKLGNIFTFVNNGVELVPSALTVTVTNVDTKNNPVSAEFALNKDKWEESTLTLTGVGEVTITIQDYYFCTPTTINVNVTDREVAEKFVKKFDKDFLYRVGNASGSTVSLGTMFDVVKENETPVHDIDSSKVNVTIETIEGDATGKFTQNTSEWTQGKIQFSGTGVVKLTITDNDFCEPTELYLEVINATNITSATGTTTGGDLVLLCDVNTTSYVNYWNCTLYGNGFTYSLNGAPTAYNSKQGHGVLITKNATLDNLVIVGDVYDSYGAYSDQDYFNAAVDAQGGTILQNCYIANCAAPVVSRDTDVTIIDSTLYGGTVANLIIKSGVVTLDNVTTVNYADGRELVGMSIVVHPDATESAKLVLKGNLTQYNFISEAHTPTDSNAKILYDAMFGSSCSSYHFGASPNRYVNTGIVSMTALFNADDITGTVPGYTGQSVRVNSVDGYVYTQPNTYGSVNNNYTSSNDLHYAKVQGPVAPAYSFDYTTVNYQAKQDGSNDYCYEDGGTVYISMDEGDTVNWDTSILRATKAGSTLGYTVTMNGTDYTGKSIAFNTAGDYVITYSYTDNNNYKLDSNGNITTYSKSYEKTVNISVAVVEAATKHAEFTFGSSNTASKTVTIGNKTYVMPNVSATSSTIGSTTVDGTTIYYPIVEIIMSDGKTSHTSGWYAYFPVLSGAVTITDYADNGTGNKMDPYNGNTTSMPAGLSVVGDPATLFKYQSGSAAGTSPVVKNSKLVYSSAKIEADRKEYSTVIQYSYQDNAGATYYYYIGYHAPAQSYNSCVTPDTLVTLADGTQKRIDSLTGDELLLVWDFYKGEYTVAPIGAVINHGYTEVHEVAMRFDDGSTIKTIGGHGFFDVSENKFVIIDESNIADYIGHEFVKYDASGNGTKTILLDYSVETTYNEAWTIVSAYHFDCILNGLLTLSPTEFENSPAYLMPFEIGEGMKYDEAKMQADIEKYGLYTYEEFSEYCTYEQFVGFAFANWKVAVGKGFINWEDIIYLINTYVNN